MAILDLISPCIICYNVTKIITVFHTVQLFLICAGDGCLETPITLVLTTYLHTKFTANLNPERN